MPSLKLLAFFDNALLGLALFLLWLSIKTCGDDERFAVFRAGKFLGLKGPGPFFRIPICDRLHRLSRGSNGVVSASNVVRFNDIELPVTMAAHSVPGTIVQVIGFETDETGFSRPVVAPATS